MAANPAPLIPPLLRTARSPISRARVERVLSRSSAAFGLVFGVQAVPFVLQQMDEAHPVWLWVTVPALGFGLIAVMITALLQRWVYVTQGAFAVVYLVALISWPFAVLPGADVFAGIHWLNYLMTIATAMATIAFPLWVAVVYLVLAPSIYLVVRAGPVGGPATWTQASLEAVYAFVLGAALVILLTMIRGAASGVDAAQQTALERYAVAVRNHAAEVERVQVDSIVHDSVLTTLTSAAKADTRQARAIAATMAGNAIAHLKAAATVPLDDDGTAVRFTELADRILATAREIDPSFVTGHGTVGTRVLPASVAESIHSAAVQAMFNSLQHAPGDQVHRWVEVRSAGPGSLQVSVRDDGPGFDLDDVPTERLGVRVSIIERLAGAGGRAEVRSAPGEGTEIVLRWPLSSPTTVEEVHS